MKRKCSCRGAVRSDTCAVHTLWDRFIAPLADGEVPWVNISPNFARSRLRRATSCAACWLRMLAYCCFARQLLTALGIASAGKYATHDFRRGHAQDMLDCGATLAQILLAGQWKSASFLKYLKEAELERDVAFTVSIQSDDED